MPFKDFKNICDTRRGQ